MSMWGTCPETTARTPTAPPAAGSLFQGLVIRSKKIILSRASAVPALKRYRGCGSRKVRRIEGEERGRSGVQAAVIVAVHRI